MSKYEIRPRPGYTIEDLILDGATFENAEIVKIVNGVVVERHPYTPWNEQRYKPKLPKELYQEVAIFSEGRFHILEKKIYEKVLRNGCNPFKQVIVMIVSERKNVTTNEVINVILEDMKLLKNNSVNRKWLEGLIKYLREQGYLNLVEGRLELGLRKLQLGSVRIPLKEGYNPILNEMLHAIKFRGTMSKKDLAGYMIGQLGWIEPDPVTGKSARDVLEQYIRYLLRNGYIRETTKDTYEFVKPLEPY